MITSYLKSDNQDGNIFSKEMGKIHFASLLFINMLGWHAHPQCTMKQMNTAMGYTLPVQIQCEQEESSKGLFSHLFISV